MKALIGGLAVLSIALLAGFCPAHVRAQAADTLQVSDETRAELSRQMDMFLEVMRPVPPDFSSQGPVR